MSGDKFNDRGYKALFSHPKMVEYLLRSFAQEEFLQELDFSTLRRTMDSFVTEEFRERESDIIWELNLKGRPAFIYLLIEFQSTVEHFMAVRLLTYILLFYQELIKPGGLKHLPPVFPVVLYNGDRHWTAPDELRELIEMPVASLGRYIPQFRYFKVAENEFSRQSLVALENLVAGVFLIESAELADLAEVIGHIRRMYHQEASPELRREFNAWFHGLLERRDMAVDLDTLTEAEGKKLLDTKFDEHERRIRDEGRVEGRVEGRAEGLRHSLKRLLQLRFGADAERLHPRIDDLTNTEKLDALQDVAYAAASVADVEQAL
ncbi:MAG: Rpn family recombination-promoting nuclease/putative transposase [Candidatus Xenobia bacterium]